MTFVRKSASRLLLPCVVALTVTAAGGHGAELPKDTRVGAAYWPTREGFSSRVLVMLPKTSRIGVLLLPGGHGNINLSVQAQIGWGQDDLVIRTRTTYAQAGFVTVIPDIATERKPPAKLGDYRISEAQAQDLGAIAHRLRRFTDQVYVIAYDRGVTSALNAIGRGKMDFLAGLVLISPILDKSENVAAILDDGARRAFSALPVLMLSHSSDRCSAAAARHLEELSGKQTEPMLQSVTLTGGNDDYRLTDPLAYYGDPCNKSAHHALAGLDDRVSAMIVEWLNRQVSAQRSR
jgi:hypothetical protein